MRRVLMLVLALLAATGWLWAQEGDPGADVWQTPSYPATIEGCLHRAGFYYLLIGDDGQVYNLTGNNKAMRSYVGRDVQLTGTPIVISLDTTEVHEASTVEEYPALQVKTAKELSGTLRLGPSIAAVMRLAPHLDLSS